MLLIIIRTIILFSLIAVALRLMGKRQIGQLQPFELVIIILLAELAVIPMADIGVPLVSGIVAIITLVLFQVTLSYLSLKSERARGIICGRPSVLIENGKIIDQELRRLRYNINDLLEQLRVKNVPNIADVEFAILETSGDLSVIPKSQKRPVIPEDLNISTTYEGLPTTLIIDGLVLRENLAKCSLNEEWLQSELEKLGVKDVKDVLFASLDTGGRLFYQKKSKVG
ncbi:uncharacterized membrane protein YcaP (DUF421 family) [Desulfohalotomaculum tongense]|uniref:YetF domain-containing protein n=1 Tax=Desulforadius tongensis TaxID=1216062 RepID=UPI001959C497|nr:DUF421 domain-containing protein [Desulforadius tongensis]MBM7855296.1 uncharacterized membrane protein YcaP (DUF421 family) [Desulforadius tongensis]